MIRITSGTVRTSLGLKTSKDKPFILPPKEEQRFIDRKVASRVYEEAPFERVATLPDATDGDGAGVNSPENENGAEVEETTGHLNAEDLMGMSLPELKQLAADMGVDATGMKTKQDYAKAIAAVEVTIPHEAIIEEELPDLTTEEPVE